MTLWTIFTADGIERARNVVSQEPPSIAGCGIDMTGLVATPQPRKLSAAAFERVDPTSGEIVEDVGRARDWALSRIDTERSAAIARHAASTPEIRELHRAKATEAERLIAGGSDTPILDAEAALLGVSLDALASDVLAAAWAQRDAQAVVDRRALAAKAGVRAAASVAEVRAAMTVDWSE